MVLLAFLALLLIGVAVAALYRSLTFSGRASPHT